MSAGTSGNSTHWFKRAQRGLFAGRCRLTGNHVSPSKQHVRRSWLPNVHSKNLWSDILERHVRINVTTSALRQIDRMGGACRHATFREGRGGTARRRAQRRARDGVHVTAPATPPRGGGGSLEPLCASRRHRQRAVVPPHLSARPDRDPACPRPPPRGRTGFDNYLLLSRPEKLHSETGLRLRRLLSKHRDFKLRVAARALTGGGAVGAPAPDVAPLSQDADGLAQVLAEIEAADAAGVAALGVPPAGAAPAPAGGAELR